MPKIELRRTGLYLAARDALSPERRSALDEAEAEIQEDPAHNKWRRDTDDGFRLDASADRDGLLIKYRLLTPTLVELADLIDLRALHTKP